MEIQLDKFMDHIVVINKDLSHYEDEAKGVMLYMNTVALLVRVEYLELDEAQLKKALFEKKIDNLEYDTAMVDRPVPKEVITKNPNDRDTLTNQKVKVSKVWNVVNGAGAKKSFTDKFKALEFARSINSQIEIKLK